MNLDEAWDAFQEMRSIKKASVAEKLDTLAAQLNEIQTDTKRTAELVPKILGDDSAIEASNALSPDVDPTMMGDMGGAPPMDGAIPGAEEMSPDGMDLGTGDGMIDNSELPPQEEGGVPTEDLMEESTAMPTPEGAPDVGDANLPEEEMPLAPEMGLEAPEEAIEPPMEMDMGGGAGDTIGALRNMLHEMVDQGNMTNVKALADAIEQLGGAGGMPAPMEAPMPMEAPVDAGIPMDINGGDIPPMEGTTTEEPPAEDTSSEGKSSDSGSDSDSDSSDSDSSDDDEKPTSTKKSADGTDAPPVLNEQPVQASDDDANKSLTEQVGEILSEAVSEVMEAVSGEEPEAVAEVSVEESPEADLSEEGEEPFKEGCADTMKGADTHITQKSARNVEDLTFKEMLEARMNGGDAMLPFIQKSVKEGTFTESDPWGITRRLSMFKSGTMADDVASPSDVMSGKHDGTDSDTVADDLKEPDDHTKGSAPGGEMLDDVDEEKSSSEHSVEGGDKIDEVEEKKGESDHTVADEDLLDDIDEDKGTSDHPSESKDLLDEVKPARKSAQDTGLQMRTIQELMAIRKSRGINPSRPDAVSSVGGDLERPELGKVQKSVTPEPVRMGYGVDPHKVVEADWAEYKLYMAHKGF